MSRRIMMVANATCECCHGRGTFEERHGTGPTETLICDCLELHDSMELTQDEIDRALEDGEFEIISDRLDDMGPDVDPTEELQDAEAEQQAPQVIDLTPTWEGMLPMLIAMLTDGNASARKIATEELTKLCRVVDRQNAAAKGGAA